MAAPQPGPLHPEENNFINTRRLVTEHIPPVLQALFRVRWNARGFPPWDSAGHEASGKMLLSGDLASVTELPCDVSWNGEWVAIPEDVNLHRYVRKGGQCRVQLRDAATGSVLLSPDVTVAAVQSQTSDKPQAIKLSSANSNSGGVAITGLRLLVPRMLPPANTKDVNNEDAKNKILIRGVSSWDVSICFWALTDVGRRLVDSPEGNAWCIDSSAEEQRLFNALKAIKDVRNVRYGHAQGRVDGASWAVVEASVRELCDAITEKHAELAQITTSLKNLVTTGPDALSGIVYEQQRLVDTLRGLHKELATDEHLLEGQARIETGQQQLIEVQSRAAAAAAATQEREQVEADLAFAQKSHELQAARAAEQAARAAEKAKQFEVAAAAVKAGRVQPGEMAATAAAGSSGLAWLPRTSTDTSGAGQRGGLAIRSLRAAASCSEERRLVPAAFVQRRQRMSTRPLQLTSAALQAHEAQPTGGGSRSEPSTSSGPSSSSDETRLVDAMQSMSIVTTVLTITLEGDPDTFDCSRFNEDVTTRANMTTGQVDVQLCGDEDSPDRHMLQKPSGYFITVNVDKNGYLLHESSGSSSGSGSDEAHELTAEDRAIAEGYFTGAIHNALKVQRKAQQGSCARILKPSRQTAAEMAPLSFAQGSSTSGSRGDRSSSASRSIFRMRSSCSTSMRVAISKISLFARWSSASIPLMDRATIQTSLTRMT